MRTQSRTAQDAVELLISDHRKVRKLFKEYAELGERAFKTKEELARTIMRELRVHSELEEQVFYPAAREAAESQVGDVVAEGLEEHHVVDVLMQEIEQTSVEDEAFDAKMKVLCENVEHHIEEEETEMLPAAGRKLGAERLDRLAEEMNRLKQSLIA